VIAVLQAENLVLRDKVAALEALLTQDSSTSSEPPSGGPVTTRDKRAERRADTRPAAKRSQGKQPGGAQREPWRPSAPPRNRRRARPTGLVALRE
jgi:hypothetical protein